MNSVSAVVANSSPEQLPNIPTVNLNTIKVFRMDDKMDMEEDDLTTLDTNPSNPNWFEDLLEEERDEELDILDHMDPREEAEDNLILTSEGRY